MSRPRKTEKDYHALALKRTFEWLGPYPKNSKTKTLWRCGMGHEWKASYNNVGSKNSGCPHCAFQTSKTTQDYHDAAQTLDFSWIGKELPKNAATKTLWRCGMGHEWKATYNHIDSKKTTCPYCSGHASKTAQDYHEMAQSCGFKWAGKLPRTTHIKTSWRCPKGHVWKVTYARISQGIGCPDCYVFKGPTRIIEALNAMGIDFVTEKRFSACRHKLELPFDFYVPAAKLLIEYQGKQHFEPVKLWGGKSKLRSVKRNDKIKADWAQQSEYTLLCIHYQDYERISEILGGALSV